jgi:16S rRNA (adenine1518-N6/adenine1519-N6)-dimethyltransferase
VKIPDLKALLLSLGIRPSRALGQHFLVDEGMARRQVEAARLGPGDRALEVGPGLGVLTGYLLDKTPRVVAIERDVRLAGFLTHRLPALDLRVGDAARIPWPPFDWCVSNLPFAISSPVLFRLLDVDFKGALLMVQQEFAQRLIARPGGEGYSRLTVKASYRSRVELLWRVRPAAFWPPPGVSAAVVRISPRPPTFPVADEGLFLRLVDFLFQHRRKNIGSTLRLGSTDLGLGPRALEAAGPWARLRVEDLSPPQIGQLADALASSKP